MSASGVRVADTRWPTLAEYDAALEAGELSGVAGLAQGLTFERDAVGNLYSVAGGAGFVYHARNSRQEYALKVFAKHVAGRQERHGHIHDHLQGASSPLFVDFTFDDQGVWVQSEWFPAVRMEWCTGSTLNRALDRAIAHGYDATAWTRTWLGLVGELRRTHTAHGDLQHGNIMVDRSGRLRLIDYDGMFVPTMRGRLGAIERGHPAYQHPGRTRAGAPFDEHMDGVSSLVILVTLAVLTPELWRDRNDEGLIFTSADLKDHAHSELLARVSRSPEPAPKLVELLRQTLEQPVGPCPELDEAAALFGVQLPPLSEAGRSGTRKGTSVLESPADYAEFDLLLPWEADLAQEPELEEPELELEEPVELPAERERVKAQPKPRPLTRPQVLTLASLSAGLDADEIASLRGSAASRVRQQTKRLEARLDGQKPKDLIGFQLTQRQAQVVELRLAGASESACAARLGIQVTTVRKHLKASLSRFHQSTAGPAAAEIVARLRSLPVDDEPKPPTTVTRPVPTSSASSTDYEWVWYLVGAVIAILVFYLLF